VAHPWRTLWGSAPIGAKLAAAHVRLRGINSPSPPTPCLRVGDETPDTKVRADADDDPNTAEARRRQPARPATTRSRDLIVLEHLQWM